MATLLPPPKRVKLTHGTAQRIQTDISGDQAEVQAPTVVVQFVSEDSGTSYGPAVSIPSDLKRDALEALVNRLGGSEDDPVPFSFHVPLPPSSSTPSDPIVLVPTRIQVTTSLLADIFAHPTKPYTTEDILQIHCTPQSVFRVRPATRCSSTLRGHTSPILCASFSPTGRLLATGSGDNTARLWDLHTETPSHTLTGHKGWVLCTEWEGRERLLATGGHDGHVRLWDPVKGKSVGEALTGHSKWVTSLAWEPIHINPSSPRLASSSKDATVRVWNTSSRRLEYTLGGHTASVNVVRWGGVGGGVLYTAGSDRVVRVWDATGGKLLYMLKDHAHWVTTLALSTDFVLRTGPFDHNAKTPSSDEDAQKLALDRYTAITKTHPEVLISGSDDHTLFLWDIFPNNKLPSNNDEDAGGGKRKPVTRLTGHQSQISHVAFSPDGRWAASAGWDRSIRIWEGRTGKYISTLRGHIASVYRLTWSADSRLLVSASKDSTVKVWSLKTNKLHTDLPGHEDEVYCVDFVADKIVSGGRDGAVKIWKN